jgi:hypothetical protein
MQCRLRQEHCRLDGAESEGIDILTVMFSIVSGQGGALFVYDCCRITPTVRFVLDVFVVVVLVIRLANEVSALFITVWGVVIVIVIPFAPFHRATWSSISTSHLFLPAPLPAPPASSLFVFRETYSANDVRRRPRCFPTTQTTRPGPIVSLMLRTTHHLPWRCTHR